MKVLLISSLPPPAGGISTWTKKYQAYCEEHEIPLVIVNNAVMGNRARQINTKMQVSSEIKRTWRILCSLEKKLKKELPDVVHVNSSCSRFGIFRDMLCVMSAKHRKVPVVVHCHCNIQDQISGKAARFAFGIMANKADKILTLNRHSSEFAGHYAADKIEMIPNFIEEQILFERRAVGTEIKQVVFVGHVQKTKGVIEIIQAATAMPQIQFILLGPVEADIASMEIPKNVALRGNQSYDVVIETLRCSDLFLFPSYTEGFSIALAEAMASGLPAIATDVGANADMIEDKGGIIVPVGNSEAIVNALTQLYDKADRRESMAKWNVNKVREHYLLDAVMSRLMTIYEETVVDTKK